jgi:tetratricopeptide (TPR) repeat protein
LVQLSEYGMADRYTYLPQIGVCVAIAWGAAAIGRAWPQRRWLWGTLAVVVVGGLMGCAGRQVSYWRDSETLWSHALDVDPHNSLAHNDLGSTLLDQGKTDDAIEHCQKALAIRPNSLDARKNLATALTRQRKIDEANGLFAQGQVDQAIIQYRKCLETSPDVARIHNNLAQALAARGNVDEALAHYEKAVELRPDYATAHINLGAARYAQGKIQDCARQWRLAAGLQPDNAQLLYRLAWLLATTADESIRNGPEAVELANRAVQLSGDRDPAMLDTLAAAYAETGRFAQALQVATGGLALADARHDDALAAAIRGRIDLYRAGSPYRQSER